MKLLSNNLLEIVAFLRLVPEADVSGFQESVLVLPHFGSSLCTRKGDWVPWKAWEEEA